MNYPRVLLVDANPSSFYSLADALRTFGPSVLAVCEVDQALEALDEGFTPDAIVTHFGCGDCKAAELLRCARLHTIPVVSISTSEAEGLRTIGPRPDCRMRRHFQVAELVSMLGTIGASPRPADRNH